MNEPKTARQHNIEAGVPEITGYGKKQVAISYLAGYQDGKKAGIKEGVEWLNENGAISNLDDEYKYAKEGYINIKKGNLAESPKWQAKLKEWNV